MDEFHLNLGIAGHASTLFFCCALMISHPWRSENEKSWWIANHWVELLAAINPVVQVAMITVGEFREGEGYATTSASYTIVYFVVVVLLFRRRYRIQRLRILDERGLANLISWTLPTVSCATLLSLTYLFTESLGCILEHSEIPSTCRDVVSSNNAFSMVFVVAGFLRIWVMPFAASIYTPAHIVQFDFSINEMFQFIAFVIGGMLGVFMFASSTEIAEDELDRFLRHKAPLRKTIKMTR